MEETERKTTEQRHSGAGKSGPVGRQPAEEEEGAGRDKPTDPESKLDVTSHQFDPLLALYAPDVPLPFPDVRCFNNIAQYESFLKGGRGRAKPGNVEKARQKKARKGVPDPERIERLRKLMVNAPPEGEEAAARRGKKARAPKNVLTRMSVHSGSPLGELYRCVQERIRVRVHIRTFKGLRGVCSGFLVAFDKFWNMALVDVDETYRRPLLGEAINHERALTITRLFDRLRLQESGAPVTEGQEKAADGSVAADRMNAPQLRRSPRKRAGTDPRTVQGSRGSEEARGTGSRGLRVAGQGHDSSAQTEAGVQPRTGQAKPRVDYQQVHTRHINQLFIRGENVLLVNLQEL